MAGFDVEKARAAGYSPAEIAEYLASENKFDAAGARTAGYSDEDIIAELAPKVGAPGKNTLGYEPIPLSDIMGDTLGFAENIAGMISTLPNLAAKGFTGLGALAAQHPVLKAVGVDAPDAVETMERVNLPTYTPKTDRGQKVQSELETGALAKLEGVKETLGDRTLEATGSPALATAAYMAPDVGAALVGAKLPGKGISVKRIEVNPRSTVLKTPSGASTVVERQGALQEIATETQAHARGAGEGTARLKAGIEMAKEKGKLFVSDTQVSPRAVRMYARLEQDGHVVKRNPNTETLPDGELRSTDTRPVFEIDPGAVRPSDINAPVEGKIGGFVRRAADTIRAGGADVSSPKAQAAIDRLATRAMREKIGSEADQAAVVSAIEQGKEVLPGSRPTAAELTVDIPHGTVVRGVEDMLAKQPGGPSTRFNERAMQRQATQEAALEAVNKEFGPQFDAILERANEVGASDARLLEGKPAARGIKFGEVKRGLNNLMQKPQYKIEGPIRRSVQRLQKSLGNLVDRETGLIDAEGIQKLRQQVGDVVADVSKRPDANRYFARNIAEIKSAIDDAIEQAGGKGWKELQAKYSEARKKVDADIERQEQKPLVRTSVTGEPGGPIPQGPNLLLRSVLAMNTILKSVGSRAAGRVTERMARQVLNPEELATALRGEPPTPGMIAKLRAAAEAEIAGTRGTLPASAEDQRRRAQAQALRGQ